MTPAAIDAWPVHLQSGLTLYLPPSMAALSTFVLLEQEAWFEPEMSLLPLLLKPGMQVLDIGANHGVLALAMAQCVAPPGSAPAPDLAARRGHVWAFEPTLAPRTRLLRSVQANALQACVTVVPAALAEADGTASFAVHDNSELNSRGGAGERRETVQLRALDGYLAEHAAGVPIDFIKLDAEGDELRVLAGAQAFFAAQSPVVMFEFMHGVGYHTALLAAFQALGYGLFRWSAELRLLLPFDAASDELDFALNLVAVRPGGQQRLAAQGLLVTADALARELALHSDGNASGNASGNADGSAPARDARSLTAWCAQPALQGLPFDGADTGADLYLDLLARVAAVHQDPALRPAQRAALMLSVRDALQATAAAGAQFGPAAWALLVHARLALGAPAAAVQLAEALLSRWPPGGAIDLPVVAPRRADMARPRSTALGSWLRQRLAEFAATAAAHSSYFQPPAPQRWAALLQHPDHSAEIERRHLLTHVRINQAAPLHGITCLPDARHTCNPALWRGLMASMQPAPAAAGGLAGALRTAADTRQGVSASVLSSVPSSAPFSAPSSAPA